MSERTITLMRWDPGMHRYEPLIVPEGWKVSTFEHDYQTAVNCASCGTVLPFGETFTSLEIHTELAGWGYGVCQECYDEELKRRFKEIDKETTNGK